MFVLLIIVVVVESLVLIAALMKLKGAGSDGTVVVTETAEKQIYSMEYDGDLNTLDQKKRLVFKIKHLSSPDPGPRE